MAQVFSPPTLYEFPNFLDPILAIAFQNHQSCPFYPINFVCNLWKSRFETEKRTHHSEKLLVGQKINTFHLFCSPLYECNTTITQNCLSMTNANAVWHVKCEKMYRQRWIDAPSTLTLRSHLKVCENRFFFLYVFVYMVGLARHTEHLILINLRCFHTNHNRIQFIQWRRARLTFDGGLFSVRKSNKIDWVFCMENK